MSAAAKSTPAKAAAKAAKAAEAAETAAVKPGDADVLAPAGKPVSAPEDDTDDTDDTDQDDQDSDDGAQAGLVTEPCRRCYPAGWPVKEEGAWTNCAHGHGISYGQQVQITRERAVELGFLDD